MKDDAHVKRRLSTFCSHFNIIWKYKCHYCFEYDEYSLHIYWAIAPQKWICKYERSLDIMYDSPWCTNRAFQKKMFCGVLILIDWFIWFVTV